MPAEGTAIPPGIKLATKVYTLVETAAPNDIKICLKVPLTALPCASKSSGRSLMPQVLMFERTNEAPKFRMHKKQMRSQIGLHSVRLERQKPAIVSNAIPIMPSHLIPYLSNQRPVTGDIIPITIEDGIITSPETVGE